MTESFVIAFTTFFATIGSVDVAAMFAALTPDASAQVRRTIATRGLLVATCVLLLFAVAGESLLQVLGISLAALRVSGGILLLLIAIDMVFARQSGGVTTTAVGAGRGGWPEGHLRLPAGDAADRRTGYDGCDHSADGQHGGGHGASG